MPGARRACGRRRSTSSAVSFLFDASGAPLPDIIWSPTRRERSAYTGPLIGIRSAAAPTVIQPIGATAAGLLDEAAISAYCGTSEGTVAVIYDQGVNGINWTAPSAGTEPRLFYNDGTGWVVRKKNGRPYIHCPNAASPDAFISSAFPAQTGSAVTAVVVAALTDGGTTPPPQYSPRYISLLPTDTSASDVDQTGAYLLSRAGGATSHTQEWAIQRGGGSPRVKAAGVYGQLQQVTAQINGSAYTLSVDGTVTTATASLPNFNYSRIAFGHTGFEAMTSTDEGLCAAFIYFSAPAAAGLTIVQKSLADFFGITLSTGGSSTTPGRTNLLKFTLIFDEDFNTDCAEGQFLNVYGNRWGAYSSSALTTWGKDGGTGDHYATSTMSVSNGALKMRLIRGPDGKAWGCAPYPKLPGRTGWPWNDQLYGRYEYRVKVTATSGWKAAPLLWPKSDVWPRDGEVDLPDMSFTNGNVQMFLHRMNGTSGSDQDKMIAVPTTNIYSDYVTFVLDWQPNRFQALCNGNPMQTLSGATVLTSRIPSSPMRFVFQIENNIGGTQPSAGVEALLWLDYLSVWQYTP